MEKLHTFDAVWPAVHCRRKLRVLQKIVNLVNFKNLTGERPSREDVRNMLLGDKDDDMLVFGDNYVIQSSTNEKPDTTKDPEGLPGWLKAFLVMAGIGVTSMGSGATFYLLYYLLNQPQPVPVDTNTDTNLDPGLELGD